MPRVPIEEYWDDDNADLIQSFKKSIKKKKKIDIDKEHDRNVKSDINKLRKWKQNSIEKEEW